MFFLSISAGSNTMLGSKREKLAQSTDTRIYITGLSQACISFFSITTIKLPDF